MSRVVNRQQRRPRMDVALLTKRVRAADLNGLCNNEIRFRVWSEKHQSENNQK